MQGKSSRGLLRQVGLQRPRRLPLASSVAAFFVDMPKLQAMEHVQSSFA
jgi:hypothetical protein